MPRNWSNAAAQNRAVVDSTTLHPRCVVCGHDNPHGLGLEFVPSDDGLSVSATFACSEPFQGYAGLLHGGVVSAMLDGAMVHCLFRAGRVAYTGSLEVRFLQPVTVGRNAVVTARLTTSRGRMHILSAALEQDGRIKVEAVGKFVEALEK
jgi:acyl-coenzyme A thioesterase PaaI-like protein